RKPVTEDVAALPVESASCAVPATRAILNCFRLPYQRGLAPGSGRNTPMNTWFWFCVRLVALIGNDAEANTELTDWIWTRMSFIALRMALVFFAAKYWVTPPPY